jgi:hypothetical protein
MRALQAFVMLLGALAVLMIGAVPASASTDAPKTPPCHQSASHHSDAEAPAPAPGKAMKAMDCCVACVGAPALTPPARARLTAPPPSVAMTPDSLLTGESPAPEPHPPRPLLD